MRQTKLRKDQKISTVVTFLTFFYAEIKDTETGYQVGKLINSMSIFELYLHVKYTLTEITYSPYCPSYKLVNNVDRMRPQKLISCVVNNKNKG